MRSCLVPSKVSPEGHPHSCGSNDKGIGVGIFGVATIGWWLLLEAMK